MGLGSPNPLGPDTGSPNPVFDTGSPNSVLILVRPTEDRGGVETSETSETNTKPANLAVFFKYWSVQRVEESYRKLIGNP